MADWQNLTHDRNFVIQDVYEMMIYVSLRADSRVTTMKASDF